MGSSRSLSLSLFALFTLSCTLTVTASAQSNAAPRIVQRVDDSQLTVLRGNVHPMAQAKFDQGAAPDSLPMRRMMLVLQRSPQMDHSLITLLDAQQDKNSPSYHQWLTPDQFGQQFGPSDSDVQTVTAWLQLHGFQVTRVSRGRTIIEFDGTAGQVQQAFHTAIHSYMVNGEQRWANSTDPQIPLALAPVVAGPVSLNNFPRKAQSHYLGMFSKSKTSPKITPVGPNFTFPDPTGQACGTNCYAVSPYDFAAIYNVLPLWNSGIDGTGQTIAIVGRTNINVQDAHNFRALFGLPTKDPVVTLNGPDPGINGDEGEADIDVQWSGAVAKNATINFVVSESTETTDGIDLSAEYIVDNNLAGVMSESYGLCELGFGTAGNAFYNGLWEQAAAQGITVMVSTGDNGAAGCDFNSGSTPQPAQFGLEVNGIASTPFNVAVGGTDFNDFSNPQTYWNPINDPTTQQSAIGYIPETTWNDSCTNGIFASLGFSTNAETNCNNSQLSFFVDTIGGSGGASNCINGNGQSPSSCTQGYAKPSWQTGFGTGSTRNLPDVSLFASNGFVGNFYVVCQSDLSQTGMCDTTNAFYDLAGYGGTSVASPAFAGIMALVNQKTNSRQGQANYVLYKLATSQPTSFHDVPAGSTIAMPCTKGSPNCTTSTSSHSYGILNGYSTATGYDQATGLGSVNAQNLVNNWSTVTFTPSTTTLSLSPTTGITHGQSVSVTVGVNPTAATGDVSLITSTGKGVDGFTLSGGAVSSSTTLFPGGTYTVHAHYAGNGTYASSDSAPVSLTIAPEASTTSISMITFNSQGQITNSNATTAPYGSPYILRFDVKASSGTVCGPLANCPTGTLAVTDNGTTLDPSFFNGVLNSLGYTEDQPVQLGGGSNAIVATYPGDSSFTGSTASKTLSITPTTTSMSAVTSTLLNPTVGTPFTLSTTINTSSSGLAPSGTVTFMVNGAALPATTYSPVNGSFTGPASLTASLTTSLSTGGSFPVTAMYAGDTNYTSASASGPTINVTNFSLGVSTPTLAISSPGGSGMLTLTVTGQSGYSGTINFTGASCTGLPRESSCSFNPASVAGSGMTTVTVMTTAPAAARRAALNGSAWWLTGFGPAAFGMILIGGNRRKRWMILLSVMMVALLLILPACGGGSGSGSSGGGGDPGTPTGNFMVTVMGTSSTGGTASTTFTLMVQ